MPSNKNTTAPHITRTEAAKIAKHICCNRTHGGNRSISLTVQGWYACAGCASFWSVDHVRASAAGPVNQYDGAGGIIRIA